MRSYPASSFEPAFRRKSTLFLVIETTFPRSARTLDATVEYLRSSGLERVEEVANSLSFFERYDNFDPRSGLGSIEIWVPVK